MKKVLIGLERTRFNYLYKYDRVRVSNSRIFEIDFETLVRDFKKYPEIFTISLDKIIPIHESENEVLLIEVLANRIDYEGNLNFSAVKRLIPLNEMARNHFMIKLNGDFRLDEVLPNEIYTPLCEYRQAELRRKCALDVFNLLDFNQISESCENRIMKSVLSRIFYNDNRANDSSTLSALLRLETTPSGIPEGRVEGLMKIIGVGYMKHNRESRDLLKSPLSTIILSNREKLNSQSFHEAFDMFEGLIKDEDAAMKLRDTLDTDEIDGDIFRFCYYYFGLKKELQTNSDDLITIADLVEHDDLSNVEFRQAVFLIASIMSYERLHESLQRMKESPLLIRSEKGFIEKDALNLQDRLGENSLSADFEDNLDLQKKSDRLENDSYIDSNYQMARYAVENTETEDSEDHQMNESNSYHSKASTLFDQELNERLILIEKSKSIKGKYVKEAREKVSEIYSHNEGFTFHYLRECFLKEEKFLKKNGDLRKGPVDVLEIFKGL
jgi:hypothetical protein